MPPVWGDNTYADSFLCRVGVISHCSGGYPGDSIPYSMHYICIDQWYQFESKFSHNWVFGVVSPYVHRLSGPPPRRAMSTYFTTRSASRIPVRSPSARKSRLAAFQACVH